MCHLQAIIIPNALLSYLSDKPSLSFRNLEGNNYAQMIRITPCHTRFSISIALETVGKSIQVVLHGDPNAMPAYCPSLFLSLLGIWSPNKAEPFPRFLEEVFAKRDLGLALRVYISIVNLHRA